MESQSVRFDLYFCSRCGQGGKAHLGFAQGHAGGSGRSEPIQPGRMVWGVGVVEFELPRRSFGGRPEHPPINEIGGGQNGVETIDHAIESKQKGARQRHDRATQYWRRHGIG